MTHQYALANGGEAIALAIVFGLVGLVIARRQPRNPIGWLMLAGPCLELISIDGSLRRSLTAQAITCRSAPWESCLPIPGSPDSGR